MQTRSRLSPFLAISIVALTAGFAARGPAEAFIVEDGKPNATIVIAENPPRTTRLAAREFRDYVKKITGAELPIATTSPEDGSVAVYVGRSPGTDTLGIDPSDLKYGAYRIVSGDDWMVLIGDDANFTPVEPWARNRAKRSSAEFLAKCDEISASPWHPPLGNLWKGYTGNTAKLGEPPVDDAPIDVWTYDERGSFNAVCGFLRRLGVRWYMPGKIGEICPQRASIELPKIDETVHPAIPRVRSVQYAPFSNADREIPMWVMRLGTRDQYGYPYGHGIPHVTCRKEVAEAHPEYYALYGNKPRKGPKSCLSNPELFDQTVAHARHLFDHYGFSAAAVMPADGYTSICQCPLCAGKDTPERDYRGRLSDYVWDFVNRVAAETAKTHPDKEIVCCAYGSYRKPPLKIDKLHPNARVGLVSGRRPREDKPEEQKAIRENREAWLTKTDKPILFWENYPITGRGYYLPWFVPHVNAETINATKGNSFGEFISLTVSGKKAKPGFFHFPVYFTARMWWGDKNQDIDAMLEEYYRLFYGPAEKEMKAFFEYCEDNWRETATDKAKADRVLELHAAAAEKVDPESVYGKRVALMGDYLQALRDRSIQLGKEIVRQGVPAMRMGRQTDAIAIDGKLDEPHWRKCQSKRLKNARSGGKPKLGTEFKVTSVKGGVIFAFRCEIPPGETPKVGTETNDDFAMWTGDVIDILLETQRHSYYQIAFNPVGAVVDLDRFGGKKNLRWASQAKVATHVGDGFWSAEVFIPVVEDGTEDPFHEVVGRARPVKELPWYFNVCRQRPTDGGAELSILSPTGVDDVHVVEKFAKLYYK